MTRPKNPRAVLFGVALLALGSLGTGVDAAGGQTDASASLWRVFVGDPSSSGLFNGPEGIALDRAGHVRELGADGSMVGDWGGWGNEPGQFEFPGAIALSRTGAVFVADTWNNRIQVLVP